MSFRAHSAVFLALAFSILSTIASGAPYDSKPKVLIHLVPPTTRNACEAGGLTDCRDARTSAGMNEATFAYVLVARGDLPDVGGLEFGITYGNGTAGSHDDARGIDILDWTLCATLEFNAGALPQWPDAGSGNLITWDSTTRCQTGDVAIAGFFYLTAYNPDALKIVPRPVSGQASVATCDAAIHRLNREDLGYAVFDTSDVPGCNPCAGPCEEPPTPTCVISEADRDFGTVDVGESAEHTITISNAGGGLLTGKARENSPHFEIVSGADFEVPGGGSHDVVVRFAPQEPGSFATDVTFSTGCPGVRLTGRGYLAANCVASTSVLDFGTAAVGTEVYRTLNLRNDGGDILQIPVPVLPARLFNYIGTADLPLSPGRSAHLFAGIPYTLTIRYHPYESGAVSTIIDLGPCGPIELRGNAIAPGNCTLSATTLDFGVLAIGTSQDRTFTLGNAGPTTLSGILTLASQDFRILEDPAYTLGPSDARTFTVRFAPTRHGVQDGAIDPANGCGYLNLTGSGDDAPKCNVYSGGAVLFDSVPVGGSLTRRVVVRNDGGMHVTGEIVEDCPDFSILIEDPRFDLPRNRDMVVLVRFAPSRPGPQACTINLGPDCAPLTCTANSVETASSVTPLELNFGTVKVGESAMRSIAVRNTGAASFDASATSSCAAIAFGEDGHYHVEPGMTANLSVLFKPEQAGTLECTIQTGSGQTVIARGTAESGAPVMPTTWSAIKTRFN